MTVREINADDNVVKFTKKPRAKRPEIDLLATHTSQSPTPNITRVGIDLSGMHKIIFMYGMGSVGKSHMARWIMDYRQQPLLLASVAANRTLARFYPDVITPEYITEASAVQMLEDLFNLLSDSPRNVLIDFPGGDGSLSTLLRHTPGIFDMLEARGVATVGLFPMSAREEDITPLATLTAAGFKPKASALILNIGRVPDPTIPPEPQFERVVEHSVFRAAVARGAVPLWMPRLYCAPQIEENQLLFTEAASGIMPADKEEYALSFTDRIKAADWERQMKAAMAPIQTWLP